MTNTTEAIRKATQSYDEMPITVYRRVRREDRICNFGSKHGFTVYAPKRLGPVVEYRPSDNGYYVRDTPVRKDYQGREYHYRESIDYWGGGSWLRSDKEWFSSSMEGQHTALVTENACEEYYQ